MRLRDACMTPASCVSVASGYTGDEVALVSVAAGCGVSIHQVQGGPGSRLLQGVVLAYTGDEVALVPVIAGCGVSIHWGRGCAGSGCCRLWF